MSIFGRIRAWFAKRRLATPRKYAEELKASSWHLGSVPEETTSDRALKPADRQVLAQLDNVIQKTRAMRNGNDALDLAEALLIKGFIFRVRGVDLSGLFGAWGQLNDCIKVCRVILNQFPAAEAADVLSQAALYLAETQLAIAEDKSVPEETREEAKTEANRYFEECVEWSRQLENSERAKSANQLLRRVSLLSQATIQCPRCKRSFDRPDEAIPKDAVSKKLHDGKAVVEVMKCKVCAILYCWPNCCEAEPCICGSTRGFVSQAVYAAPR